MLKLDSLVIANGDFRLSADFEVPLGCKVAVIGPSGAGKSTLIGAIAGFQTVESGRILWGGRAIEQDQPGQRPVAMLFQDGNLFPHLTIAQNAGLGIRPDLKLTADQDMAVLAALDRVGLSGMGGRKPGELSGGQQSRAALARVLVQDKPLVLLDEPFAALGPALKGEMLDLVDALLRETGATLLMVSHDPSDARRIADQVILVEGGRAHAPVETHGLLDNPPPALKAYLG
ncbi:thiamine ABC transporter ATP-binding protein [Phaeobacter marinintestinus]|uniref:thiamine ABC transporter ATP-binding protein n=1 Tax=Falsiphaeobacter marinintestinus TaxID=1492905 RepID=UPI0011B6D9BA|nr:ATP-binding cassette domain-containing protein [Phaeobacter marinintestinus]